MNKYVGERVIADVTEVISFLLVFYNDQAVRWPWSKVIDHSADESNIWSLLLWPWSKSVGQYSWYEMNFIRLIGHYRSIMRSIIVQGSVDCVVFSIVVENCSWWRLMTHHWNVPCLVYIVWGAGESCWVEMLLLTQHVFRFVSHYIFSLSQRFLEIESVQHVLLAENYSF